MTGAVMAAAPVVLINWRREYDRSELLDFITSVLFMKNLFLLVRYKQLISLISGLPIRAVYYFEGSDTGIVKAGRGVAAELKVSHKTVALEASVLVPA
jgi:hypothetical protein